MALTSSRKRPPANIHMRSPQEERKCDAYTWNCAVLNTLQQVFFLVLPSSLSLKKKRCSITHEDLFNPYILKCI